MKRSRPVPFPDQEDRRNRTDELLRIIRFMKAHARRPSAEMTLMRKAAIENHPAFEPGQIRDPSAREALGRLFNRHQNIILETSIPGYHDLSQRRAPEPHFHATLLAAALTAPALCPFYRKHSCSDFLKPNGLTRAKDDRNFFDALLIMNKTCAATLAGRTLSIIPWIAGIAARLGAYLQAHRTEPLMGDPSAPSDTRRGLAHRWSIEYTAPNHVARDRIMYHLQDFSTHVEDLSDYLAHLMVTHHGPGFRENIQLAVAFSRIMHCISVRDQIPPLVQLRPGGTTAFRFTEAEEPPITSSEEELENEMSDETM